MIEKTVVVSMMGEAEERPVAVLVQVASQYDSKVHLVTGDKRINAKSLINIISACIKTGAEITFECDGEDEEAAMAKVEELASQNFGE